MTVVTPQGRAIPAQMGDWNNGDPVIHVRAYQMEVPAEILREEGWQIPDLGGAATYEPGTRTGTEGSTMNDAGGELERTASFHDTGAMESQAREIVKALLSEAPLAAQTPPVQTMTLPYKSRTRGMIKVKAEVHGDVAVFQDDNGHWTARNLRTQNVISVPDKEAAIQAVAY